MMNRLRRPTVSVAAKNVVGIVIIGLTVACSTPPPGAPDEVHHDGGDRAGGQVQREEPIYFVGATYSVTMSEVSQTGTAGATLAMSNVQVFERHYLRGSGSGWEWYYVPIFRVTETSGATGITITSLSYAAAEALPLDTIPLSVEMHAGGSSELGDWFQDNDYGAPAVLSPVSLSVINVTLTFTDDRGGTGRLSAKFTLI